MIRLASVVVLGVPGASRNVCGTTRSPMVLTVVLVSRGVFFPVITIGLIMVGMLLVRLNVRVMTLMIVVLFSTFAPTVLVLTLLSMVSVRVVTMLSGTGRMFAMFKAPRIAMVATVAVVQLLSVATAPTLVRTFVLLLELELVTMRM